MSEEEELDDLLHSMDPGKVYAIGVKSGKLSVMREVITVLTTFKDQNKTYSKDTLQLLDKLIEQLKNIKTDE